jgi:hypothetical protein
MRKFFAVTMTGADKRTNAILGDSEELDVKGFEFRKGTPSLSRRASSSCQSKSPTIAGSVVSDGYALANFLGPLDAADMSKSQAAPNPFDPSRSMRFDKLAILAKNVPEDRHAFRLAQRPTTIIVDEPIAEPIEKARLTGIKCVPFAGYIGAGTQGV